MAYSIACADAGMDCPVSFTTEDRDELIEHAVAHEKAAHPEVKLNDATMALVDSLIKTV
jgi:predicted small metal-binding protein